jgi:hypothetical protein
MESISGTTGAGHHQGGDLLSLEDSAARATPLRSWTDAERARLAQSVSRALSQWREAWGLAEAEVRCEPSSAAWARAPEEDAWRSLAVATPGLWWTLGGAGGRGGADASSQVLSPLGRGLFGDPLASAESRVGEREEGPTIAAELVQSAWSDFATRIAGALGAVEVVDPSRTRTDEGGARRSLLGPWSGALSILVPWWDRELVLLVSGERVARSLGRGAGAPVKEPPASTGGLTPILDLLRPQRAQVRAQLACFEIDLGTLVALRCSDVLQTTHPLERPLDVKVVADGADEGGTICTGFLGRVGAAQAVELAAHVDGK